ncbi:hypothetical protein ACJIZ3_006745 [Penstemon smallii]|uniref:Uncharacterized protein n=1 Tax=Penstemon smallii TaxID=265156 RepID=A0ABD3S8U2_9LAMI
MMTLYLGHNNYYSVKMIFLVLFVSIFFKTPAAIATGNLELFGESSGGATREDDLLVDWAGYGEKKLSTVVINGKLLCHAAHKTSVHPHPVSGASMGVFCGTSGKTKKSWAKGSTNSYGEFLIDIPSHLHAIPNLEKICIVHVFHLPKSSPCRHGFTGKHKGIELTSIGEGIRTYTTHDIHLMSKHSQALKKKGSKKSV